MVLGVTGHYASLHRQPFLPRRRRPPPCPQTHRGEHVASTPSSGEPPTSPGKHDAMAAIPRRPWQRDPALIAPRCRPSPRLASGISLYPSPSPARAGPPASQYLPPNLQGSPGQVPGPCRSRRPWATRGRAAAMATQFPWRPHLTQRAGVPTTHVRTHTGQVCGEPRIRLPT